MILIVDNLLCGQTENKGVLFSNFLNDLHVCTVHGSQSRSAVQHDFMLPVPEASLLAVDICSDTSAAAKISSALDTR